MNTRRGRPRIHDWFVLGVVLVAACAIALVIALIGGTLFDAWDDLLTWALFGTAVVVMGGWWRDTSAREAERTADEARREEERRDRDREHLRERDLRAKLQRARKAEQDWARELRSQLSDLHRQRGVFGQGGDVREMVLRTAVELVEADRGILLSREDADHDGDFDTVCHVGFENDPVGSAVAQAYASRVLGRDETVREDDSRTLRETGRTPADEEIDNLLAIPIFIQEDFSGVVLCANRKGGFDDLDDDVLLALGDHAGAVLENGRLEGEMRSTYVAIVRMLAEAIEAKDPSTRLHSEEVASYVAAVADRLALEPAAREDLVIASLLHDVGKIGISERILLKPGPLTPEERDAVEMHPQIGLRLVGQVPALGSIGDAVLHHHERYDGRGYPSGLAGEDIPLDARVVCVADSFSAMTAKRPYRDPMSTEDACVELERCKGTHFDPEVVDLFVEEVRARPADARPERGDGLASALEDPEVRARRNGDEPVLGYGPVGAVDNLTMLYSLRHFHEATAVASATGRPFAVVLVELTDLPAINQLAGYAAGDRAIVDAARVASAVAAQAQGIASRYGGRRLALLAPGTSLEGAVLLARELELLVDRGPAAVCTSAATWQPGESGEDVIARARAGLIHARVTSLA